MFSYHSVVKLKNMLDIVQKGFDNNILLHHVQRQVVGDQVGGRPHQGRPENDGQIGDLHPVLLLELCDPYKVL